jgi:hypothetical protein
MDEKMEQCLQEGNCNDCQAFVGKIGLLEGGPDANGFSGGAVIADHSNADVQEVQNDVQSEEASDSKNHDVNEPNVEVVETKGPRSKPTLRPTHMQTNKPTKLYIPKGPCSGEPCFIPPELKNDPNNTLQFCRSSEGICGVGDIYCNADSTWTDFCHNCDTDSPHGCPTYGCSDCKGDSQICVGNLNGFNPISDEDCSACADGQTFWPCDIQSAEGCW